MQQSINVYIHQKYNESKLPIVELLSKSNNVEQAIARIKTNDAKAEELLQEKLNIQYLLFKTAKDVQDNAWIFADKNEREKHFICCGQSTLS